MNPEEQFSEYADLLPHEMIYKELYNGNPDIYYYDKKGQYYANWDEYVRYYHKTKRDGKKIISEPPTLFDKELTENDFFKEPDKDVDVVFNARYCPPFWHDLKFIKIMYVINGELEINISLNKKIVLRRGNFVIVPPNIMQSVFSGHDDDIVVNIFLKLSTFEKTFASMLMEGDEIAQYFWKILYGKDENSMIWFRCEENSFLLTLVRDIIQEHQRNRKGSHFLLVSYVTTFVAYALVNLHDDMVSIEDERITKTKFTEIIQYIRANYNNVTLTSLAVHFNKNECYLSRYIKYETGYSLVQLLKRYRVRQAAVMLRETECSVENIMYEVGYTDISYFYKIFKEFYGMTPKKYRELDNIITLR